MTSLLGAARCCSAKAAAFTAASTTARRTFASSASSLARMALSPLSSSTLSSTSSMYCHRTTTADVHMPQFSTVVNSMAGMDDAMANAAAVAAGAPAGDANRAAAGETAANDDPNHIDNIDLTPAMRRTLQSNFKINSLFPVQTQCFQHVMAGRDVIARSRTGTGKTLAFCLPMVQALLESGARAEPGHATVVILEPTRELAKQVAVELRKLSRQISVCVVYGGSSYAPQEADMRKGVDFLVACPGRLIDHLERGNVSFATTTRCVLDESDEMLRMGFMQDCEKILSYMPAEKQMMLFSATMPRWVQGIARSMMADPVTVDIVGDDKEQTNTNVTHLSMCAPLDPMVRADVISELVSRYSPDARVIVFCKTKMDVDRIVAGLSNACAIHGDVAQNRRETMMAGFRKGTYNILVATDVAARGLDVPKVGLVIQSYFPEEPETYVHRSGRTGRAGNVGYSIILHSAQERSQFQALARSIGVEITPVYPLTAKSQYAEKAMALLPAVQANIDVNSKQTTSLHGREAASELLAHYPDDEDRVTLIATLLDKLCSGTSASSRSILTATPGKVSITVSDVGNSRAMVSRGVAVRRIGELIGHPVLPTDVGWATNFPGGCVVDVNDQLLTSIEQGIATESESDRGSRRYMAVEVTESLHPALFQGNYSMSHSTGKKNAGGAGKFGRGGPGGGGGGRGGGNFNNNRGAYNRGSGGGYNNNRGGNYHSNNYSGSYQSGGGRSGGGRGGGGRYGRDSYNRGDGYGGGRGGGGGRRGAGYGRDSDYF